MALIGNIIYSNISSKEKVEKYQQIIRDEEWYAIKQYISLNSNFLDVGCGAGYAMQKAKEAFNYSCYGIEPDFGGHGVGRFVKDMVKEQKIVQGFSESLPYENQSFDVVYSSHVLEHVNDEQKSLGEMRRVLKDNGFLIIGMPTTTMTVIRIFSQIVFTTHIKIYEAIKSFGSKKFFTSLYNIFKLGSHSHPRANTAFYDLSHYRVSNWKNIVSQQFEILEVIEPCLYPYPDFIQWFKLHQSPFGSSSVFFICKKK